MSAILNRRQFLYKAAICSGTFFGLDRLLLGLQQVPLTNGTFLGTVDFLGEGPAPLETRIGVELDERYYTDLSRINSRLRVTPISEFYIRTGASQFLPGAKNWQISIDGLVEQPMTQSAETLHRKAQSFGLHLMECAGNNRLTRFGLLSVADWIGVPFFDIANRARPKRKGVRVLISGFDQYATESRTSIPGASWVFPLEELHSARAFFATGMNGAPLSRDHGAPVRLVVPGWYGCACIKWVQKIAFVEENVAATSQMQEFAARTLQNGMPQLAREYLPATIDQAAIPIRVEKWRVADKINYRIVGIAWGGTRLLKELKIRFNPEEPFVLVEDFHQSANDPWTIWTHRWIPPAPDIYAIRLAVDDPFVRTRKLELGYYDRSVQIMQV